MAHPHIHYLILGDSLAVGVGAIRAGGFVKKYKRLSEIELQEKIKAYNLGKPGITSSELLRLIKYEQVTTQISKANIITISIGGNDLIQAHRAFLKTHDSTVFENALHTLTYNLQYILTTITLMKKHSQQPYLIRVIGLYNPYPQYPYSHYWVNLFNQQIKTVTSQYGKFVDIYPGFSALGSQVLSTDRIHPNKVGYELIAMELYQSGYMELFYRKRTFF